MGFKVVRELGGDRVVVECGDCGRQQGHYLSQPFECQYKCWAKVDPGPLGPSGAPAASGKYKGEDAPVKTESGAEYFYG